MKNRMLKKNYIGFWKVQNFWKVLNFPKGIFSNTPFLAD
jgi:hypothetical protein